VLGNRVLVGLVVLITAPSAASPPEGKGRTFMGPKAIMDLMERSPRQYRIEQPEQDVPQWRQQNLALMYAEVRPPLGGPTVKVVKGVRSVEEHEVAPALISLLAPVETLFHAEKYTEAEAGYLKLLERLPNEVLLHLNAGDAAFFDHRPADAEPRYRRATVVEPLDYHGHFYLARALLALGRRQEALDEYVRALVLRPHGKVLRAGLEAEAQALGVYVTAPFAPGARAEKVEGAKDLFRITVGKPATWVAWGNCKAAWLGEPEHRVATLGRDSSISVEEEKECLMGLAVIARATPDGRDPMIDHVLELQDAGELDSFIVFELLARRLPDLTLKLTDADRANLEKYVRRWVLVPEDVE
jgi:tetratricopeptide (TPR) repeat protein